MINRKLREIVYLKYNGHCAYCGDEIKIKDMHIDHIIPKMNFLMCIKNKWKIPIYLSHLTDADVDHIDNLHPSCRVCNKRKDTFDIETFRNEIEEQVNRLNKYSSSYRLTKKYNLIQETIKPIIFYFEIK